MRQKIGGHDGKWKGHDGNCRRVIRGLGIYPPPNIFGSVGNFLFHSVKIAAVGKSRKS